MNNKNIEMMKKLIEEKKKKGINANKDNMKAKKIIGKGSKGIKTGNGGGLFDK